MPPSVTLTLLVGGAAGLAGSCWCWRWCALVRADAERYLRAVRPLVTTAGGRRLIRWLGLPRPVVRLLATRTAHRRLRRCRPRLQIAVLALVAAGAALGSADRASRSLRRRLVSVAAAGRRLPAPGRPSAS